MNVSFRKSGINGCEIIDADGRAFAWAVDPSSAAMIVAALTLLSIEAQPPQSHLENGTGAIEPTDHRLS
jgi:hypothetical protein